MDRSRLDAFVSKYRGKKKGDTVYGSVKNDRLSLLHVRDLSYMLGRIVEEDLKEAVYVIAFDKFPSSFANAFAVIALEDKVAYIASYAEEGLIKQHIAQNNLDNIIEAIEGVI